MSNPMREKLKGNDVMLGLGIMYASPSCIEIMAPGWDWIWIDGQHGQHDLAAIRECVETTARAGLFSVARVPGHEPDFIRKVVATAADGIMVPLVDTADQAELVVDAARSAGENEDLLIVAQIETLNGVSEAAEIAEVEGVDVLFFGPDDMKMRMGLPMNTVITESEKLTDAMRQTARAALDAAKFAGGIAPTRAAIRMAFSLGYTLLVGGGDVPFLRSASPATAAEFRAALNELPPAAQAPDRGAY